MFVFLLYLSSFYKVSGYIIESDIMTREVGSFDTWDSGVIAYEFSDDTYDQNQVNIIKDAMEDISKRSGALQFIERTDEEDYLYFFDGGACWSYLGKVGGKQLLSLGTSKCVKTATVQHELMHALGFLHEQNRNDRDNYVKINWENIIDGMEFNFNKGFDSDMAYDYNSIMHYGQKTFSKNRKPTIEPIKRNIKIGNRVSASPSDIKKIQELFGVTNPPNVSDCYEVNKLYLNSTEQEIEFEVEKHTMVFMGAWLGNDPDRPQKDFNWEDGFKWALRRRSGNDVEFLRTDGNFKPKKETFKNKISIYIDKDKHVILTDKHKYAISKLQASIPFVLDIVKKKGWVGNVNVCPTVSK